MVDYDSLTSHAWSYKRERYGVVVYLCAYLLGGMSYRELESVDGLGMSVAEISHDVAGLGCVSVTC